MFECSDLNQEIEGLLGKKKIFLRRVKFPNR